MAAVVEMVAEEKVEAEKGATTGAGVWPAAVMVESQAAPMAVAWMGALPVGLAVAALAVQRAAAMATAVVRLALRAVVRVDAKAAVAGREVR